MKHQYKTTYSLILLLWVTLSLSVSGQNVVSYAYDNAGNRISCKIVLLKSNTLKVKNDTVAPLPIEEQLGDRKITVYPNPTKGALAVEILGGKDNDEITIFLISAQGVQLQTRKAIIGITAVNMSIYPPGWYILRVQAGDKVTELKIIKQ